MAWDKEIVHLEKESCCLVRIHVSRSLSRALANWIYESELAKWPF